MNLLLIRTISVPAIQRDFFSTALVLDLHADANADVNIPLPLEMVYLSLAKDEGWEPDENELATIKNENLTIGCDQLNRIRPPPEKPKRKHTTPKENDFVASNNAVSLLSIHGKCGYCTEHYFLLAQRSVSI
jgi:hypothetical protein